MVKHWEGGLVFSTSLTSHRRFPPAIARTSTNRPEHGTVAAISVMSTAVVTAHGAMCSENVGTEATAARSTSDVTSGCSNRAVHIAMAVHTIVVAREHTQYSAVHGASLMGFVNVLRNTTVAL